MQVCLFVTFAKKKDREIFQGDLNVSQLKFQLNLEASESKLEDKKELDKYTEKEQMEEVGNS